MLTDAAIAHLIEQQLDRRARTLLWTFDARTGKGNVAASFLDAYASGFYIWNAMACAYLNARPYQVLMDKQHELLGRLFTLYRDTAVKRAHRLVLFATMDRTIVGWKDIPMLAESMGAFVSDMGTAVNEGRLRLTPFDDAGRDLELPCSLLQQETELIRIARGVSTPSNPHPAAIAIEQNELVTHQRWHPSTFNLLTHDKYTFDLGRSVP